jgi:hypothetical protein
MSDIKIGKIKYDQENAKTGDSALNIEQASQYIEDLPEIIDKENKELNAKPTYSNAPKKALTYWYAQAFKYKFIKKPELLFLILDLEGIKNETLFKQFYNCTELKINTLEDVNKRKEFLKFKIKEAISFVKANKIPILKDAEDVVCRL